jgi:hypothetical protein
MTWEGAKVHVVDQIWLGEEGATPGDLAPAVIEVTLERNALKFLVP